MAIKLRNQTVAPSAVANYGFLYMEGGVLKCKLPNGTVIAVSTPVAKRATVRHTVAAGSTGGISTNAAWTISPLDSSFTYNHDSMTIGVTSNQITLSEAGFYRVSFKSAMSVPTAQIPTVRLRDVTNGVTLALSLPPSGTLASLVNHVVILGYGEFTVTTPITMELQYYLTTGTGAANRLSVALRCSSHA